MSAVYKIPYEKSFASHPKAEFWHPTKKKPVVPREVFKSKDKIWIYYTDYLQLIYYLLY